jgi:hypothetical protein
VVAPPGFHRPNEPEDNQDQPRPLDEGNDDMVKPSAGGPFSSLWKLVQPARLSKTTIHRDFVGSFGLAVLHHGRVRRPLSSDQKGMMVDRPRPFRSRPEQQEARTCHAIRTVD